MCISYNVAMRIPAYKSGYIKYYTVSILLILLLILRFVRLDMDTPANNIAGITHVDEPYYTFLAVHDQIKHKPGFPATFNKPTNSVLYIHSYWPTKLGFLLFGNTYYGLRFAPVLISLVVVLLLSITMVSTYFGNSKDKFVISAVTAAFLLLDPYYFIVSRYQTPMIYATLWHALGILFVYKYCTTGRPLLLFIALCLFYFTVFFVYHYTIFAAVGISFFVLYESILKRSWKPIVVGAAAAIACVIMLIAVLQLFGYGISDYFDVLFKLKSKREEIAAPVSLLSFKTLLSPLQIFYTNLLRYNPIYFFSIIFYFFFCITKFRNLKKFEIFIFFALLCAIIQTVFITSYPFKKWVLLFPFAVFTILPSFNFIASARKMSFTVKAILASLALAAMVLCFMDAKINSTHQYWAAFDYGFEYQNPSLIIRYMATAVAVVIFSVILFHLFAKNLSRIQFLIYSINSLSCSIFIYEIVFRHPTYDYKNMLTNTAKMLDHKIIVGDLSHAYTFYNSSLALTSSYAEEFNVDMRLANCIGKLDPSKLIYIYSYKRSDGRPPANIVRYNMIFKLKKEMPGKLYSFGIYAL